MTLAVALVQFAANLIIVGCIFRLIQMKYGDTWIGRSLAVVY